jgi:hypothetical protein
VLDGVVVLIRCVKILAVDRCDLYWSAPSLPGRDTLDQLFDLPFASWGGLRAQDSLAGRGYARLVGGTHGWSGVRTAGRGYARLVGGAYGSGSPGGPGAVGGRLGPADRSGVRTAPGARGSRHSEAEPLRLAESWCWLDRVVVLIRCAGIPAVYTTSCI